MPATDRVFPSEVFGPVESPPSKQHIRPSQRGIELPVSAPHHIDDLGLLFVAVAFANPAARINEGAITGARAKWRQLPKGGRAGARLRKSSSCVDHWVELR